MTSAADRIDDGAVDTLLILDRVDIDRLPWHPVVGCPGVWMKELWRVGDLVHALVHYDPDSRSPGWPHLAAHHHIWVVAGSAAIAGRPVSAGSYAHIPPGVAHSVTNVDPQGCTLLQLHRPTVA